MVAAAIMNLPRNRARNSRRQRTCSTSRICEPSGWVLHRATDLPDDILRRQHFGSLGNGLYIRPDHRHLPLPTGLTFRADLIDGVGEMRDLVEELWLIERYAAEYQIWIDRFQPLLSALERVFEIADKTRLLRVSCLSISIVTCCWPIRSFRASSCLQTGRAFRHAGSLPRFISGCRMAQIDILGRLSEGGRWLCSSVHPRRRSVSIH